MKMTMGMSRMQKYSAGLTAIFTAALTIFLVPGFVLAKLLQWRRVPGLSTKQHSMLQRMLRFRAKNVTAR